MSASRDRDEWDMEDSDDLLPSDSGYGDEKVSERNRDLKQHNGGMSESKPVRKMLSSILSIVLYKLCLWSFMNHVYNSTQNLYCLSFVQPEKRWTKQFPFSVFFIVGNEFCERFSYYGMRAVLVLFLTHQLGFGDDSATALYHSFIFWCYFLPLLGAIISDSCLGKYGTILSLSVVYAIGNIVVSVSAIPFNNATQANIALAAVGLIIIAVGTGGIKPCVSAFGGDQFTDDQEKFRRYFFSLFYFSINAGSVISTLLTPILRDDINCFGTGECFTLAFGVPAVLMILSLVVFIVGTRFYVILKPKKESARLFLDVPLCISSAIYRRVKHGRISTKTHWLQYASPKFSVSPTSLEQQCALLTSQLQNQASTSICTS
jgi:dipeptide/tripeptide permease